MSLQIMKAFQKYMPKNHAPKHKTCILILKNASTEIKKAIKDTKE